METPAPARIRSDSRFARLPGSDNSAGGTFGQPEGKNYNQFQSYGRLKQPEGLKLNHNSPFYPGEGPRDANLADGNAHNENAEQQPENYGTYVPSANSSRRQNVGASKNQSSNLNINSLGGGGTYLPYEQVNRAFSRNNPNQQSYSKSYGSTNLQLNKMNVNGLGNLNVTANANYAPISNYKLLLNQEDNAFNRQGQFKPPIYQAQQPTYGNSQTPNYGLLQNQGNFGQASNRAPQNNIYNFANLGVPNYNF